MLSSISCERVKGAYRLVGVCGALDADNAEITITPAAHDAVERGNPVTVRVTMAASQASWLDCGLFSLDFDVSSEVTQIKE